MSITINKNNFSRFSKRLQKTLEKHSTHLPLSQVHDIAAQSLGKENYHELQKTFDFSNIKSKHPIERIMSETEVVEKQKKLAWIIESASIKIGMGMGRPGWQIGADFIEDAINKALALEKEYQ